MIQNSGDSLGKGEDFVYSENSSDSLADQNNLSDKFDRSINKWCTS